MEPFAYICIKIKVMEVKAKFKVVYSKEADDFLNHLPSKIKDKKISVETLNHKTKLNSRSNKNITLYSLKRDTQVTATLQKYTIKVRSPTRPK